MFDEGGFSVFECFKGDDALIDAFFEEKFKNGSDPSDPLKETYNNPNSRAINRYSLLFQNCVTTTLSAASIGQCGIFSNAITPLELNNDLRIFNPGSVKVVNNPKVFLLELLQELWDALSN